MTLRSCRYLALATCAMSILLWSRADAQTVLDEWYSIKTGPAAVLLSPSSSSVVVATVAAGTRVRAQRIQGDWYLVRLPKANNEPAAVSGWIPAAMLSRVRAEIDAVGTSSPIGPTAQVVLAAPLSATLSESVGLLNDLRSQRDKVDAAIQALDGVADAQALRIRRDKLDRAIHATEDLAVSDAEVTTEAPTSTPVAARNESTPASAARKLYIDPSEDAAVKNVETCLAGQLEKTGFDVVSKDRAELIVRVRKVPAKSGSTKVPEVWMRVTNLDGDLIWEGSQPFKHGKSVSGIGANKDCSPTELLATDFAKKVR